MKNDLISRADALALIEYMGPAFHAPTIREALARIKGLPAADAEQVVCWTPVENGLPVRQYEDTGLTPDEIAALKADRDQWQDGTIIVKLADAEAEIERLCAALKLAQARAGDLEDEIAALRAENEELKAENERMWYELYDRDRIAEEEFYNNMET